MVKVVAVAIPPPSSSYSFRADALQAYISHADEAILQSSLGYLSGSPSKIETNKDRKQLHFDWNSDRKRLDLCGRKIPKELFDA